MYELIKEEVINRIANGKLSEKEGGGGTSKWLIGGKKVNVRCRTGPTYTGGLTYAYDIYPYTLEFDFVVWICGRADHYYFIPIRVIKAIYNHPYAFTPRAYPEKRVANINVDNDQCRYATDGQTMDFTSYYCATM